MHNHPTNCQAAAAPILQHPVEFIVEDHVPFGTVLHQTELSIAAADHLRTGHHHEELLVVVKLGPAAVVAA